MYNYKDWCRLCGSVDGTSEIETDVLHLIEILEISPDDTTLCWKCNQQLEQTLEIIKSASYLRRLFEGLKQENECDLTLTRLNAYRAHFSLEPIIEDEHAKCDEKQVIDESNEYIEYKIDNTAEEIVTETFEDVVDSSLIIQEEFGSDDEIFMELEEESEVIEYSSEEHPQLQVLPKTFHFASQKKTEDEKLFTFRCHVCSNQEFQNMKNLAVHCKESHNCLPQVKCCSNDCDSVLSTWRRLMIHKEKHFPNDSQLRCHLCQKVYVTAVGLEKHMEKHSIRLICSQCGKNFKDPKTLRWHEETHQKSLEERRNHQCPYPDCGQKFITKQACENHIGMKHQKVISCYCNYPNCDKGFYTKKAYYEHLRNTHSERRFSCEQCNFKAKTKSALRIHKDVHTVGELYLCDICDAAFSVYRRLKAHMICHSNVTPFQCSNCDVAFKRSKDLKAHSYIHTKERPFSCQFCSKTFANGANARKHKLKDHAEQLRQWELEFGVGGRKKLKCYQ